MIDQELIEHPPFEKIVFHQRRKKYAICIPVKNEGEIFVHQLQEMHDQKISDFADIIILDGNSDDGSTAPSLLDGRVRARLINNSNISGLGLDYRMGFAYAMLEGYSGVITIDGNGKDDPSSIPDFIAKLEQDWDFIQGSRYLKEGQAINTPITREFAIRFIHAPLISLGAKFWYSDTTNGFRGHSRRLILHPEMSIFREIFTGYELLAYISVQAPKQADLNVIEIPVTRGYPESGNVPTKIVGVKAKLELIKIVLLAIAGYYSP